MDSIYIFGYGGSKGSAVKITTVRAFDSIDGIIELLLKEFINDSRRNYFSRVNMENASPFELFMARWSHPPKVYLMKLNDENEKPKLIKPTR